MEGILLLIAVLACPLGMLAMGAIAWASGKVLAGRSNQAEKSTAYPPEPSSAGGTDQ